MKQKYFNRRSKRRAKFNMIRKASRGKLFSKRMGGIIGGSVLVENRNINANDLAKIKKEVL